MRSPLLRSHVAQIATGAAALAAAVALVVAPAAGRAPATQKAPSNNDAALTSAQQQEAGMSPAMRQQLASITSQVNSLIGKMTLAEKIGQLEMSGPTGANGTPGQTLLNEVRSGEVGSVLDLTGVNYINQVQRAALQSRLKIPVIFGLDVIHGYKTIFPVPLGEAASWDPTTIENDASISASEATADGIKWTFNPMVDVSRDPRWGRVVEGSGEDPFLGSAMAVAKVRGYQGTNFSVPDKMAATVKHFGGYGAVQAGREYNTTDMSEQQLANIYLPPYKAAIDAGAATVMSAFTSLDGVPDTANPYLLTTILRNEWGFGGTVVSDYQAVQELEAFGYATSGADAAKLALTAGVTIEMGVTVPSEYSTYTLYLPRLVKSGQVSMATINNDVRHVLDLKFLAGLFAHPLTNPNRVKTAELTPANLAAARTSADESMVLLNNQNHALPLSTSVPSIAVVGPLADDPSDQLGPDVPIGYSASDLTSVVPVLDGIKAAAPGATITYAEGCDAYCTSTSGFAAAVSAAKASAVTVIVAGEPAAYSGEASSRSDIDLPGQQTALIQAIAATGKPYVVVLMNGRPLTLGWVANNAPGLIEAWYPGTEGGNAVADVLFGKVDPGGKLPMTFPVNVGQIPISYNELPTGRPYDPNNKYTSKYLDVPNAPQYPFGYGLSYTTFSLSNLHLSDSSISTSGTVTVSADITNTGSVAGADVGQLYIHEDGTTILQPVRRLEGFQRVTLAPGQTKTVTFTLSPSQFGFYNNSGQFEVDPGTVDVWVGDSSTGGLPGSFTVH
ncbi:MAG TPA: glycoside hydrolase family 3 N-terminal domain-containing protein [Trebonia sp.]|nr:glycoside hydrolase family 3 N-terminal domain-containing protein [Trebonia sp.]